MGVVNVWGRAFITPHFFILTLINAKYLQIPILFITLPILTKKEDYIMEEKRELYDKICKLLTWYEQENECPISKEQLKGEMYSTLVEVQNFFCENYGF